MRCISTPDMKVLRPNAEKAVGFFEARESYKYRDPLEHISCIFSRTFEGKFIKKSGNPFHTILHNLVYFGGRIYLYSQDGFDQEDLIHDVKNVRIIANVLSITGLDEAGSEVMCQYIIHDEPDPDSVKPPIPYGDPRDTEHVRWVVVRGPEHWEQPETKEAEVPKPVEKPAVKKTTRTPSKTPKKGVTYEVRVNSAVQGSFSSKAKAESYKKELKAKGLPARIYGVRE